MLLGILLYCFKRDIRNLSDIVVECKTNRILRVFTRKYEPSLSTFKRFLENSSPEIMRKVFLYTLVVLNDYEFLKFIKAFIFFSSLFSIGLYKLKTIAFPIPNSILICRRATNQNLLKLLLMVLML